MTTDRIAIAAAKLSDEITRIRERMERTMLCIIASQTTKDYAGMNSYTRIITSDSCELSRLTDKMIRLSLESSK